MEAPNQSSRSLRSRFRFSLRTLFILMTIACVWAALKFGSARRQECAVKAIEAAGGTVAYDWQFD